MAYTQSYRIAALLLVAFPVFYGVKPYWEWFNPPKNPNIMLGALLW